MKIIILLLSDIQTGVFHCKKRRNTFKRKYFSVLLIIPFSVTVVHNDTLQPENINVLLIF